MYIKTYKEKNQGKILGLAHIHSF